MDDKVEKNKLQIHKEATEWAKKINLVYENLINGSEVSNANFWRFRLNLRLFYIVIEIRPENYHGCNSILWSKLPKTTGMC